MSVLLEITFGKDQKPAIEATLQRLTPVPKYSTRELKDGVHYSIQLESAYQVYLFGHEQAKFNPFRP